MSMNRKKDKKNKYAGNITVAEEMSATKWLVWKWDGKKYADPQIAHVDGHISQMTWVDFGTEEEKM
jgi:hypothetical protein